MPYLTEVSNSAGLKCWCREGESNPQGTKYRRILSPLRLPVPPSRLGRIHLGKAFLLYGTHRRFEHGYTTSGFCTGIAVNGNSTRKEAPSPRRLSTVIDPRC